MRWTPIARRAQARGILNRLPMFTRIAEDGVRMPDGSLPEVDAILWATGSRPALEQLAPLHLRTPQGGFRVAGSRSPDVPRLFFIGSAASASTVGARSEVLRVE